MACRRSLPPLKLLRQLALSFFLAPRRESPATGIGAHTSSSSMLLGVPGEAIVHDMSGPGKWHCLVSRLSPCLRGVFRLTPPTYVGIFAYVSRQTKMVQAEAKLT